MDVDRVNAALGAMVRSWAPAPWSSSTSPAPCRRSRADVVALLTDARRPRPRVRAAAATGTAELELYGEIGWDVQAPKFLAELRKVTAGTISLRINSPGGHVFDGLAIYNALRDHAARVEVSVDGVAASAASFIAMAGDQVVMNRGSQMMIHDAWLVTAGDEAEHLTSAELLGRTSNMIAALYAGRAGGPVAEWRERMRAETWYSAEEAVDVGLADELVEIAATSASLRNALSGVGQAVHDAVRNASRPAAAPDHAAFLKMLRSLR